MLKGFEIVLDDHAITTVGKQILKKSNLKRMNVVLFSLFECLRQIGIFIQPFLPNTSDKILDCLSIEPNKRDFINLSSRISFGKKINAPNQLFPRINV